MGRRREPGEGRLSFGWNTGLRKLQRALRRGRVPPERMGVIERAMQNAAKRRAVYLNSCPAKRMSRKA